MSLPVPQSKSEERMAGGDGDILLPVDLKGDRAGSNLASQTGLPENCAGPGIEDVEVAFPPAREKQIGCCCQYSAIRHVCHCELPFLLPRIGIDCNDGT